MNLGIDMDSTLIEIHGAWSDYFNAHRQEHGHAADYTYPDTWSYPVTLCSACLRECCDRPDVLLASTILPDAADVLERLSSQHSLYLISHRRPQLRFTAVRLLKELGVYEHFERCIWSRAPKVQTCHALRIAVMLDDGPANIAELSASPTLPVIFDQPYNRHLEGIRVTSWIEFEAFVSEYAATELVRT